MTKVYISIKFGAKLNTESLDYPHLSPKFPYFKIMVGVGIGVGEGPYSPVILQRNQLKTSYGI